MSETPTGSGSFVLNWTWKPLLLRLGRHKLANHSAYEKYAAFLAISVAYRQKSRGSRPGCRFVFIIRSMERINSVNPDRILWCSDERGVSIEEMAKDVGIAPSSIEKLMSGEGGLTFGQLTKLSEYFGRGALFFLEPEPVDAEQVHTPQFRTLANQKPELSPKVKAIIERAEKQRDLYLSLSEDLEIELVAFAPPNVENQSNEYAASAIREWLGLDGVNTFDGYRQKVEEKGALVFRSNGYAGKWQIPKKNPILGFSIYDARIPLIFVKKQAADVRQTFTLMHELGHIVLHKSSYIDDIQDVYGGEGDESEANAFAGLVLVPNAFLRQIDDRTRPQDVSEYDAWLETYRRAWGVSGEVILRRLLNARRLPNTKYNEYRRWREDFTETFTDGGSRKYRHREPKHVFGDTFVRTVLDARSARQISLAKATKYLDGLKLNDFHSLERYYEGV